MEAGEDEKTLEPRVTEMPPACPCAGATPTNATYFRFTKDGDPKDWWFPYQRRSPEWYVGLESRDRCLAHGHSLYSTLNAIVERQKIQANIFRDHSIVAVSFTPEMGPVLLTKPQTLHWTWWPADDFVPPPAVEEVRFEDSP